MVLEPARRRPKNGGMNHPSRWIVASAALAVASLILAACASPPTPARAAVARRAEPGAKDEDAGDPVLKELVDLHNRERAKADRPPLKVNKKLEAAAKVQADDMAQHQKMAHKGSDGSTPAERIERQNYKNLRSGENVAYGQKSPEEVIGTWMNSPGHKQNILGDFREIGVARTTSKDGTIYWCVDFGQPRPELDAETAPSEAVEGLNRARKEAEAPPLKAEPKLEKVARNLARSLADARKLDPKFPAGQTPIAQIDRSGYRYRSINLAFATGQVTAEDVVRTWTERPEQKKAVLDRDATAVGIGCAADSEGVPYWCLILAEPAPR